MTISSPPRESILGVQISLVNLDSAVEWIRLCVEHEVHQYVCVTPVHSLMECQRDPELMRIFNHSGLTTPDGMPLVWVLRRRGFLEVNRVYGPDLMNAVCGSSSLAGLSHFFYGGAPGVAESLAANLRERFTGMIVAGVHSPPFRELSRAEDRDTVALINSTNPQIVWVGLGSPKQERWMAAHVDELSAPVLIGVGAAFDFLSGAKAQAPPWMQRNGLEWLFRLLSEPRRLWKRYLLYNSWFLYRIATESLTGR